MDYRQLGRSRLVRLSNGKSVGAIMRGIRTFVSIRQHSKHFFRKAESWAFDLDLVTGFVDNADVMWLAIIETDEEMIYIISLERAFTIGSTDDYGHGRQLFIPRSAFREDYYGEEE